MSTLTEASGASRVRGGVVYGPSSHVSPTPARSWEQWLQSTQAPAPSQEASGSRISIYVLVVSAWLLTLVACLAWWKRNVETR